MYSDSALVEGSCSEEVLVPHRQQPKPWRRLGLAAAIVGTLGTAVGAAAWARGQPSAAEQWMQDGAAFIQGFTARELGEESLKTVSANVDFLWNEEDADPPKAMKMEVKVKKGEQPKHPHAKFIFAAKEGQAEHLEKQLEELRADFQAFAGERWGHHTAKIFGDSVEVSRLEGKSQVAIICTLRLGKYGPPVDESTVGKKLGDDVPSLSASLSTGHDIDQMLQAIEDGTTAPLLPGGIKFTLASEFAKRLYRGLVEINRRGSSRRDDTLKFLKTIASFSSNTEIAYRKEEIPPYLFHMKGVVAGSARSLRDMVSEDFVHKLGGLQDNAAGLDSILIQGLPKADTWEFDITFQNFKISHLFGKMVEELLKAEQ